MPVQRQVGGLRLLQYVVHIYTLYRVIFNAQRAVFGPFHFILQIRGQNTGIQEA